VGDVALLDEDLKSTARFSTFQQRLEEIVDRLGEYIKSSAMRAGNDGHFHHNTIPRQRNVTCRMPRLLVAGKRLVSIA